MILCSIECSDEHGFVEGGLVDVRSSRRLGAPVGLVEQDEQQWHEREGAGVPAVCPGSQGGGHLVPLEAEAFQGVVLPGIVSQGRGGCYRPRVRATSGFME